MRVVEFYPCSGWPATTNQQQMPWEWFIFRYNVTKEQRAHNLASQATSTTLKKNNKHRCIDRDGPTQSPQQETLNSSWSLAAVRFSSSPEFFPSSILVRFRPPKDSCRVARLALEDYCAKDFPVSSVPLNMRLTAPIWAVHPLFLVHRLAVSG